MDGITQKAINELFVRTDILERELMVTTKKLKRHKRLSAMLILLILASHIEVRIDKKS